MKVVTIEEDNHGQIGIASNYQNAIHFLVNENWLDELTEVYDSGFQDTKLLLDLLGEEWLTTILNWTLEKFNEFFDCCFYLNEVTVYEVDQSTSLMLWRQRKKILDNRNRMWYYNYRKRGKQNG